MLSRLLSLCLFLAVTHAEAARVVTLSPHATELVWFAGGGSRLVGISSFSDFPKEITTLPVIGDAAGLDRERVISLQPDLLVYWSNGIKASDLEWLERRGIRTFATNPVTIDGLIDARGRPLECLSHFRERQRLERC